MLASRGMRLATGTHGGCESADPVSASRYCGRLKVLTMAWGVDLLVSFFAHHHKAALLLMLLLNKEKPWLSGKGAGLKTGERRFASRCQQLASTRASGHCSRELQKVPNFTRGHVRAFVRRE